MSGQAAELAQALARHAEAVCRYYLPNGRRHGRYWLVGDINNTPGRSLYVRLAGPDAGPGAAGKWTDAATGEHGDLLDLIAANRRLDRFPRPLRRGAPFSQPAATRNHPLPNARDARIAGSRAPAVSRRGSDQGNPCRSLSAGARHHRAARRTAAALPSRALVSARRQFRPASPGRGCSPPSPMCMAGSPAFTAPGSIGSAPRRRP